MTRQRRNPYQEGLALLELSRLYYAQAKDAQGQYNMLIHKAADVLDRAISAFEQLGARYDLQMAQALQLELHKATPRQVVTLSNSLANGCQY